MGTATTTIVAITSVDPFPGLGALEGLIAREEVGECGLAKREDALRIDGIREIHCFKGRFFSEPIGIHDSFRDCFFFFLFFSLFLLLLEKFLFFFERGNN